MKSRLELRRQSDEIVTEFRAGFDKIHKASDMVSEAFVTGDEEEKFSISSAFAMVAQDMFPAFEKIARLKEIIVGDIPKKRMER